MGQQLKPTAKSKFLKLILGSSLLLGALNSAQAFKIEDVNFDTMLGIQNRSFDKNPLVPKIQRRHEFATIYFQQEISYRWNNGRDSVVFTPFLSGTRYEDPWKIQNDGYVPFVIPIPIIDFGDTRTVHKNYGDIREFLWTHISEDSDWELRTGIGKVFWGSTESQHLVDVINQTDLRTDVDGEDKLGQPMVNLTIVRNWGNLDLFALPGFRERLFPQNIGRLAPVFVAQPHRPITPVGGGTNPAFMINQDKASYESNAENTHTDFAARWSNSIGVSDIGLSVFYGTNRDPVLNNINEERYNKSPTAAGGNPTPSPNDGVTFITPHYEQMTQLGIDYQATLGDWLLKFEGVWRDSDSLKNVLQDKKDGKTEDYTTSFSAITTGYEYTFTGVFDTNADLGVIMEYSWDSRKFEATTPYQNDAFLGFRLATNSENDTAFLIGVVQDLDIASYVSFFEASQRLGQHNKLILEGFAAYSDPDSVNKIKIGSDATYSIANEDHVRVAWETYF